MPQKKVATKTGRTRYSTEFKQQALLRAVKDGVPVMAQDLGLEAAQLYAWRSKAGQQGQDAEAQRLMQSEQARIKREVARLEEEKKQWRTSRSSRSEVRDDEGARRHVFGTADVSGAIGVAERLLRLARPTALSKSTGAGNTGWASAGCF